MAITLKTLVSRNDDLRNIHIPEGAEGTVIDIIIEDGGKTVNFLLEFDDGDGGEIEWFSSSEVEEKF